MNVLDHFSVPFKGLKNGLHHFKFDIDDAFFGAFENAYVSKGKLTGNLKLDKRPDLAIADLALEGNVETPCDRCLKDFLLPVEGSYTLHIKTGHSDEEYDEVIFVDAEESHINFATFVYDCVCLSLPMTKVHESEQDCDPEMIARLNASKPSSKVESVWTALTGINLKEDTN